MSNLLLPTSFSQDFQLCPAKLQYVEALQCSVTLPLRTETPKPLKLDGNWNDRDFQAVVYLQLVLEQQGYLGKFLVNHVSALPSQLLVFVHATEQ